MTLSRWHEDLAAHDEAFACLQDLLDPSSFATTVVKAFREWGQGLLRLATALVRENAALERENATLRDRIAELELARMRAVIDTARKQGWNVLQTLVHPDPIQLIPQLRL